MGINQNNSAGLQPCDEGNSVPLLFGNDENGVSICVEPSSSNSGLDRLQLPSASSCRSPSYCSTNLESSDLSYYPRRTSLASLATSRSRAPVQRTESLLDNYPLFLPMPIDKAYEAKYVLSQFQLKQRSKSWRERVFLFLEYPSGWACFCYHFVV